MNTNIKMVVSDLDGTLLNNQDKISDLDYKTLYSLGKQGVVRVFATGRSLAGVIKSIDKNTPYDYIIFSTGCGIYSKKLNKTIYSTCIDKKTTKELVKLLQKEGLNFTISGRVPHTHHLYYHQTYRETEFEIRLNKHKESSKPLDIEKCNSTAQILSILENNDPRFSRLKALINNLFPNLNVIRASSPISYKKIWLEIYPKGTSKFSGVKFIAQTHNIKPHEIVGLGNDFNDIDFLSYVGRAFVTSNATEELKKMFPTTVSNNDNPLTNSLVNTNLSINQF